MALRTLTAAVTTILFAGILPAHGGQYRGGNDVPPGSGAPPPTPGVNTGVRPVAPTSVLWQTWWEFNKDPMLQRRAVVVEAGPISGSDDFYLGTRRAVGRFDVLMPTDIDLRDVIVPALGGMLAKERNRDIVTACLIALGKVGRDGPGVSLEAVMSSQIKRDDQEVRETAVLALGIAGRKESLPVLLALARDTAAGRKLEDRAEVSERTRAFATFGLGLLARRSDDIAIKQEVHDLFVSLINDRKIASRELRVAAINGLGILGLDADQGAQKRLLWQSADELTALFAKDVGPGEEMTIAHAPIAIARLLGRGSSDLHQKCKSLFADELTARSKRGNAILRSAAIALGVLSRPAEDGAEDAQFSRVLQQTYDKGSDQHSRLFSLISLGRIGGAGNRAFLLKSYENGNKVTERPWAALALGLLTFEAGTRHDVDEVVARLLLDDLLSTRDESLRGALAVAVGLTGYAEAAPAMLRLLHDNEREQMSAGYLCIGMSLLGDRSITPALSEILDRSARRPFLMQHCAVALGMLGDREASMRLVAMMQESDSVAVLSSLATAIGRIGDRRSIEPLIAMMRDDERTKLARAFVAAALGAVGDKDELPWNMPLSKDSNYASPTETLANGKTGILDIL